MEQEMLRHSRISLLVCLTAASFIGSVKADCPEGDLNRDCQVDLLDVQILAEHWLANPQSSADLTGDDGVNMHDFALLAAYCHH